ncbi:MAG: hypothetical protein IPH12_09520 [Saprospirales bacterium]|nr:hypothetical protein [Saprospirales bacterium]
MLTPDFACISIGLNRTHKVCSDNCANPAFFQLRSDVSGCSFKNRLVAVEGFEWVKMPFFRLARQILQSKSGIFDEKFNAAKREKGFFPAKDLHRNKSNEKTDKKSLRFWLWQYLSRLLGKISSML